MPSLVSTLLVAAALFSSGVLQVAAAAGEDACCAEEREAPCADCPLGTACTSCPFRGAVRVDGLELAPATPPSRTIVTASAEPSLQASVTDIFRPPRA